MIGFAILGYVAVILVLAPLMGRRLRKQSPVGRLPELETVRDDKLDIKPAIKRGGGQ